MAVSGAIIDYAGAGGERNYTLFIQLTFSGSFTAGGDPLNLATLANPNGLDLEGLSELPLSLAPSAQSTADTLGSAVIPTVDLLRIGLLL